MDIAHGVYQGIEITIALLTDGTSDVGVQLDFRNHKLAKYFDMIKEKEVRSIFNLPPSNMSHPYFAFSIDYADHSMSWKFDSSRTAGMRSRFEFLNYLFRGIDKLIAPILEVIKNEPKEPVQPYLPIQPKEESEPLPLPPDEVPLEEK